MSNTATSSLHNTTSSHSTLGYSIQKPEEVVDPSPSLAEIPECRLSLVKEVQRHIPTGLDERILISPQSYSISKSGKIYSNTSERSQPGTEIDPTNTIRSPPSSLAGYATREVVKKSRHNHTNCPTNTAHSCRSSHLMPPSGPVRLFIASLGNPTPYQNTRHSAGHVLLKSLQSYLSLPPLSKSKGLAGGYASLGSDVGQSQYTLWQSPSLMNISGVNLLKAYKSFLSTLSSDETDVLVILHDEMETAPAQIKLRRGPTSPKGHNGIKSVQQSLQGAGLMDRLTKDNGGRFLKVAVGIGRPEGGTRDKDDVSAYVLGQLRREEKEGIESCAGNLVEILDAEVARIGRY